MVSSNPKSPAVSGIKLSSVVPAEATGNQEYELRNIDLAMKLHYIKGVYFFTSEAVQGLTVFDLKEPMFQLLVNFNTASGRIRRRPEAGRPFIKCNDGGVRTVEAFCDQFTIEEWLAMDHDSRDDCLAYNCVLGPDLEFSPLVFVQFTWFKCGGMSLGVSWSHVLGDPLSASAFVNNWALLMAGHVPTKYPHVTKTNEDSETEQKNPAPESDHPGKVNPPVKRVDPVGDYWQVPNNCNMKAHTFRFTAKQIDQMASSSNLHELQPFEVISAALWKLISKARDDSVPEVVTICRYNSNERSRANEMVVSTVEVDSNNNVAKRGGGVWELAMLLIAAAADRKQMLVSSSSSESTDLIMYGANLTFVDMEEADVYGLKLQGEKPVFVSYTINGVGDEGVVLVLAAGSESEVASGGRTVTVVLPEDQLEKLKNELKRDWDIV